MDRALSVRSLCLHPPPLPLPGPTYSSQSSRVAVMSSWYTSAVPMARPGSLWATEGGQDPTLRLTGRSTRRLPLAVTPESSRGATGAWAGSQKAQTGRRPQPQLATEPGRGRPGSSRALASSLSQAGLPCARLRLPQSPPRRSGAGPGLSPSGAARLPSSPRPPAPRAGSRPRTPAGVRAARCEAGRPVCLSSAGCRGGATRVHAPRSRPAQTPRRGSDTAVVHRRPALPRPRKEGSGRREGARGRASAGARQ